MYHNLQAEFIYNAEFSIEYTVEVRSLIPEQLPFL